MEKNFNLVNSIYLPKQIFLKFCDNDRGDTVDGKLSFPSYLKKNGKVTHERSMDSWGNKKIPTELVENTISDGYIINLSVARSNDWYSSGRSMIRIYSPKGFEFEITVENFCYICEYADISRKYINCELAFGFCSGKPILIPTSSPLYQQALLDTDVTDGVKKKDEAFSAISENITPGKTYKNGYSPVIYLGSFPKNKLNKNIPLRFNSNHLIDAYLSGFEFIQLDLDMFKKKKFDGFLNETNLSGKEDYLVLTSHYNHNNSRYSGNSLVPLTANKMKSLKPFNYEESYKHIGFKDMFGEFNFDKNGQIDYRKVLNHLPIGELTYNVYENVIRHFSLAEMLKQETSLIKPYYEQRTVEKSSEYYDQQNFYCLDQNGRIIVISLNLRNIPNDTRKQIEIKVLALTSDKKKFNVEILKTFKMYSIGATDHLYLGNEYNALSWNTAIIETEDFQQLMNPHNILKNIKENFSDLGNKLELEFPYINCTNSDKKSLLVLDKTSIYPTISSYLI